MGSFVLKDKEEDKINYGYAEVEIKKEEIKSPFNWTVFIIIMSLIGVIIASFVIYCVIKRKKKSKDKNDDLLLKEATAINQGDVSLPDA